MIAVEVIGHIAAYLGFILLLTWGGNHAVRLILHASGKPAPPPQDEPDAPPPRKPLPGGRYIGVLERLLIMLGVAASSVHVILAVIALKSVARYKELDKRAFAEYFLIGSMASFLWAVIITIAMIIYDQTWGLNLIANYVGFFS